MVKRTRIKAFTLMEMLIVMALVAVSIGLVSYKRVNYSPNQEIKYFIGSSIMRAQTHAIRYYEAQDIDFHLFDNEFDATDIRVNEKGNIDHPQTIWVHTNEGSYPVTVWLGTGRVAFEE